MLLLLFICILIVIMLLFNVNNVNTCKEHFLNPNTTIKLSWKPIKSSKKVFYKVLIKQEQNTPFKRMETVCESNGGTNLTKTEYIFTNKNTWGDLSTFRYRPLLIEIYASYDGFHWSKSVSKYKHGLSTRWITTRYRHPDSSIGGAYNPNILKKSITLVPLLAADWNESFPKQPVSVPNSKSWCINAFQNCVGVNFRLKDDNTMDFAISTKGDKKLIPRDENGKEWYYIEKKDRVYKINDASSSDTKTVEEVVAPSKENQSLQDQINEGLKDGEQISNNLTNDDNEGDDNTGDDNEGDDN